MKTFGDQLTFFTGRKDHQSAFTSFTPFNIGYILCQMNLLEEGMIGDYYQNISKMQKFLAIPEIFGLLLLSTMTSISPELEEYNTFVQHLMCRLANQTVVFEEPFAKNQEVLAELKATFEKVKKTMAIWRQHSLKAIMNLPEA